MSRAEPPVVTTPAAPPAPPVPPASQLVEDIDDFELEVPDFDPLTASLPEAPLQDYQAEIGTIEEADGPSAADVEAFQQALNQALQGGASTPVGNPFKESHPLEPTPAPGNALEDALEDDVVPAIFDTRRAAPQHEPEPETEPKAEIATALTSEEPIEPPYDPAIGNEPDTGRRRPWVTALLLMFALIGLLLLAGQLVYINRTLIAAQVPEMRPNLEKICKRLGCTVPLSTDQEYIRTEWSELSFVPEHTNLVQLSATLKNHAPYPQAYPVLEVTLKDADNQVLIRKVFTPREYLKPENKPATSFASNSELKITMRFDVGKVHAQGYSLYWFYP